MEAPTAAHRRIVDQARQYQADLDAVPRRMVAGYWVTLTGEDGQLDRQFTQRLIEVKTIIAGWNVQPGDRIHVDIGTCEI